MANFVGIPSIYPKLLELRKSKDAEFKTNKYWNPTMPLRYYQVIGALHMMLLERMVLGDSTGLGKCVSEDTLIPTSKGLIRIGDLFPESPVSGASYPAPSLQILSRDGPTAPSELYDSGRCPGLRVTTRHGYSIQGLSHHPILTASQKGVDFQQLSQIKTGDFVCINRKGLFADTPYRTEFQFGGHVNAKQFPVPEVVTEDLAELLGYYVSEGCRGHNSFSICQFEPEAHNRIRDLLFSLFQYTQSRDVADYSTTIDVNSEFLKVFFRHLGTDMEALSGGQIVPKSVLMSPKSVMAAFLRGYFEGDGGVESQGIVSCSSKSEMLLNQIQQMLLLFGVVSRRRKKMVKIRDTRQLYWILYFCGENVEQFQREVGFVSTRKRNALRAICGVPNRNTNVDIIPFGRELIRTAMSEVIAYLKTLPEHKGFSVPGSGWKGLVGVNYKRVVESYVHGSRRFTRAGLSKFIGVLEDKNIASHIPSFPELLRVQKDDFFYDEVVSTTVEPSRYVDFVVPEGHNFTGGGFVNHNTPMALAAYSFLLERDPNLKLLVVCMKSALFQWAEEATKFLVGVTCRPIANEYEDLEGHKAHKKQYQDFKENIMVVHYATILEEYEAIKAALGPSYMLVIDEVHTIKNWKTKSHFACQYLSQGAKRVYGLSATIIKNGLEEVWGVYAVVVPGLFGKITHFRDKYCKQTMMRLVIGGKPRKIPKTTGYKNIADFKVVLDPYFLIRKKEEVATELPKLISRKIVLDMPPDQKAAYRQALAGILYEDKVKQEFYEISDKIRTAAAPDEKMLKLYAERKDKYEKYLTPDGKKRGKLAALTYCQMISNGPALLKMPGESSKDEEFIRLIKDELQGEKVIVFSRFSSGIPYLEVQCERNRLTYVKITGDQSDKERTEARLRFQTEKDCNIIFITTAGSASLNLQAASTVIFIDTPWSYGDLVQIIGRAQRIGSIQDHILLIHLANRGTIDMRVLSKVTDKKDLSDEVLGDTAKGALDFVAHDDSVIDSLYADIIKDAEELK